MLNLTLLDEKIIKSAKDVLTGIRTNRFIALLGDAKSTQSLSIFQHVEKIIEKGEPHLQEDISWRCINFRPGISPIENLAAALATPDILINKGEVSITFQQEVEQTLRKNSLGLISLFNEVKEKKSKSINLLILINRFDDLFELIPDDNNLKIDRLNFVNLLLTASIWEESSIYLAISISPNFISECFKYGGLGKAIQKGSYFFKALSLVNYTQNVEIQFKEQNQTFRDELTKDLKTEKSIGDLGFKWNFLMAELNNNEQDIAEGYRQVGGLHKVINSSAENLFNSLTPKEQLFSKRIFRACSQISKNTVIVKPVTLNHIWKLNQANDEKPSVEVLMTLIRKYQSINIIDVIEPTKIIKGLDFSQKKILILPVNSLVLNQWTRAVKWAKEESILAFNYQNIVQNVVQHFINNKGKINDEELLTNTNLENAKHLFEVEDINDTWAEQYFDLKIPSIEHDEKEVFNVKEKNKSKQEIASWVKNSSNTLLLSKKFVDRSWVKKENDKRVKELKKKRINRFFQLAAFIGIGLALIAIVFWIKAEKLKSKLMEQNFIIALSEAHLIDISFDQVSEVLNDKNIKNYQDIIDHFEKKNIISYCDEGQKKIVENAFFSVFNLDQAIANNHATVAVISKNAEDLLDLITQGKNIENQYYYMALKAHYDKLLKLKYPSKSEGYDSFDGFMVVKSNPTKDKQFAFINKFGQIFIVEKTISVEEGINFKKIATVTLPEDVNALAYSENGKKLYAGTISGKLYSWLVSDMTMYTKGKKPLMDVGEKIYFIEVQGNNDQLFFTTEHKIFDVKNKELIFDTQSNGNNFKLEKINSLAISPNNQVEKYLLVGGAEKTLVFDLEKKNTYGKRRKPTIFEHFHDVNTAMSIDDNNDIAIGTVLGKIYLFNLNEVLVKNKKVYFIDEIIHDFINHNNKEITSVDLIDNDGQSFLAYSNIYGDIKLSIKNEIETKVSDLELIGHQGASRMIMFNSKNELISMEDNKVLFWSASVEELAKRLRNLIARD